MRSAQQLGVIVLTGRGRREGSSLRADMRQPLCIPKDRMTSPKSLSPSITPICCCLLQAVGRQLQGAHAAHAARRSTARRYDVPLAGDDLAPPRAPPELHASSEAAREAWLQV